MSDSSNGPAGGDNAPQPPPPPPEWVAPAPPWTSSAPPSGGGFYGQPPSGPPYDPYGPWNAFGTGPDPADSFNAAGPPSPRSKRRIPVAITAVIAVLTAIAGVAIGTQLGGSNTPAASPAIGSNPGIQTSPTIGNGGSGGNGGFGGNGGNGGFPFNPSTGNGSQPTRTKGSPAAEAIAAKVNPGVVDIDTQLAYQGDAAAGTGMVLTSSGLVLTNNHVIDQATSIRITLVTTGKSYTGKVVGYDATDDVAVLQMVGASGLHPVKIGDSSTVVPGDTVVAIGNAGGIGGLPSVVSGIVQTVNQAVSVADQNGSNQEYLKGMIGTSDPIKPGDSGGPLVNTSGQVIGMDTAGSTANQFGQASSIGLAIPTNKAMSIAKQIEAGKASSTVHIGVPAFLGVELSTSNTNSGFGGFGGFGNGSNNNVSGALIAEVISGSPADSAGLVPGDTITSIDGKSVTSTKNLISLTQTYRPGDRVSLGYTDNSGATHTINVTLTSGPPA